MITITLANSKLGRLAIEALLRTEPANSITAVVRDPGKAADLAARGVVVRQGDYDHPATIETALAGSDVVVLISGPEVGKRVGQHQAIIDAAKASGAKRLIYTGVLNADRSGLGLAADHRATEAAVRAAGIPWVILRNAWYIENYTGDLSNALNHGVVPGAAEDGRISAATRADFAEAIAVAATGKATDNMVYELGADAAFTLSDLAAEIARQSGKPVAYHHLSETDYAAMLTGFGLPPAFAAEIAGYDVQIAKGALENNSGDLSRLLGRPATTLAEAVAIGLRR